MPNPARSDRCTPQSDRQSVDSVHTLLFAFRQGPTLNGSKAERAAVAIRITRAETFGNWFPNENLGTKCIGFPPLRWSFSHRPLQVRQRTT